MAYLIITKQKQGPAGAAGGASVPVTPIAITASVVLTSPSSDQSYYVQSSSGSGPITVTIAGVPVAGVRLKFYDQSKNWTTYHFTITVQAGWTHRHGIAGTHAVQATQ